MPVYGCQENKKEAYLMHLALIKAYLWFLSNGRGNRGPMCTKDTSKVLNQSVANLLFAHFLILILLFVIICQKVIPYLSHHKTTVQSFQHILPLSVSSTLGADGSSHNFCPFIFTQFILFGQSNQLYAVDCIAIQLLAILDRKLLNVPA